VGFFNRALIERSAPIGAAGATSVVLSPVNPTTALAELELLANARASS